MKDKIDPISRWIAIHFARHADKTKLEQFILDINMINYGNNDDRGWGGQGIAYIVGDTTYTATVDYDTHCTDTSIGISSRVSMLMRKPGFTISSNDITVETPKAVKHVHHDKLTHGKLMLSDIIKLEGVKDVPIIEMAMIGDHCIYRPKAMRLLSWPETERLMRKASLG